LKHICNETQCSIFCASSVGKKSSSMTEMVSFKVFSDGASRGNPGDSGAGVFLEGGDGKVIAKKKMYLGRRTNNQAEFLALAYAAFLIRNQAKELSTGLKVTFVCDSELLVRQMSGVYRVKNPDLLKIKRMVDYLIEGVDCKFKHVFREKNAIADGLANDGIDSRAKIPKEFSDLMIRYEI
jgi:ribonuclease HI